MCLIIGRISINESYTDVNELEKPIAMFEAVSNVADPEIELFELLRGKSAMTNSEATFKLSQKGNQAFLYRLLVNYEAVPMYYLTIRVKNKQGGEAETVLQVDVVDNNDEVPVQPHFTTFHHISSYFIIFHHIQRYLTIFKDIYPHFMTFRDIKRYFTIFHHI